jgi:uncharacterized protein YbcC (UPF0753/DUF2309 family)
LIALHQAYETDKYKNIKRINQQNMTREKETKTTIGHCIFRYKSSWKRWLIEKTGCGG